MAEQMSNAILRSNFVLNNEVFKGLIDSLNQECMLPVAELHPYRALNSQVFNDYFFKDSFFKDVQMGRSKTLMHTSQIKY